MTTTTAALTPESVDTYNLCVLEFGAKTRIGGSLIETFVQRVGDHLCFYEHPDRRDTDIASNPFIAEYVVRADLFARIVDRLSRGEATENEYSYFNHNDDLVIFEAPCGDVRYVTLAVLQEIVRVFC